MSQEDAGKQQHRYAVTTNEFVRFLESKTPESACPGCQSKDWTVVGSAANGMAYRFVTNLRDGPAASHISTFAINCDECGYVRHHWARKVKEWVTANPVQQEIEFEEGVDNDAE